MLPLEHPDRIQIAFDDHRLVNNAGLLPATLAQRVGLLNSLTYGHLACAWAGELGRPDADAGGLGACGRRPLTTPMHVRRRTSSVLCSKRPPPWGRSWQLPVGPCPKLE